MTWLDGNWKLSVKMFLSSAGYPPISEHLVNTWLNCSEKSHVSSAVDSTWEVNEQLRERTGEACWPVTLAQDQVCVKETTMVKWLSEKIITGDALLAAGGRSVKDQETEAFAQNKLTNWKCIVINFLF